MIPRIVGRRVRAETARRAVLKSLVDRKDDHLPRPAGAAVLKEAAHVLLLCIRHCGIPAEDLVYA